MRTLIATIAGGLLIAGVASAQGAGGGGKETIAQQLRNQGTAGPGFVQQEFMGDLSENLTDVFGPDKSKSFLDNFKSQGVDASKVTELMNGRTTDSEIGKLFGANRTDAKRIRSALDDTVQEKDKKMFFGIVIVIVVVDFDVDPSSEFAQQLAGAKSECSPENFERLTNGEVSKSLLEDVFGMENKGDLSFMQRVLNALKESPFVNHPMCESMGMGKEGGFDASKFPKPESGMPGYGEGFDGGMAGGLPFDSEMPPCPFGGSNMEGMFPGLGGGEGATHDTGG